MTYYKLAMASCSLDGVFKALLLVVMVKLRKEAWHISAIIH